MRKPDFQFKTYWSIRRYASSIDSLGWAYRPCIRGQTSNCLSPDFRFHYWSNWIIQENSREFTFENVKALHFTRLPLGTSLLSEHLGPQPFHSSEVNSLHSRFWRECWVFVPLEVFVSSLLFAYPSPLAVFQDDFTKSNCHFPNCYQNLVLNYQSSGPHYWYSPAQKYFHFAKQNWSSHSYWATVDF